MSSEIAIKVENISKCYQIYNRPHDRLKQSIYPRLKRLLGKAPKQYFNNFWALKDVTFEVKKGESVGIIGRNGSGKSTLLQMICGTLNPTSGSIQTNGRVAALLELGSGFNPEFTGRENVYMNAALLGLTKKETEDRFENIVNFADIGEFIEQPVKTYSSGMMLRLAFAVIAHVDADILIVDEALAVGDIVFTQKCMRFLRRFMEKGTVLFVSHDMASISNLCNQAIWLNSGLMEIQGPSELIIQKFIKHCSQEIYGNKIKLYSSQDEEPSLSKTSFSKIDKETKVNFYENISNSEGWTSGAATIEQVLIMSPDNSPIISLLGGEKIKLKITISIQKDLQSPIVGFFVKDRLGQSLFGEHTYTYTETNHVALKGSLLETEFIFNLPLLPNGEYSMTVSIADGDPVNHTQHHWLHDAVVLHVQSPKLRYGLVGINFDSVSIQQVTKK